jgi:hypothetical protein
MKKFTITCSDEKSAPLGSYLIANKIEFECENIVGNTAPEIVEGQKPSTNSESMPCLTLSKESVLEVHAVCFSCERRCIRG